MPVAARRLWGVLPSVPSALGPKLVLLLTAIGLGGAFAITLLLSAIIMPGFSKLEAKQVEAEVARVRAVLDENASMAERAARDQGARGEGYVTPSAEAYGLDLPRLLHGRSSASFYLRRGGGVDAVAVAQVRPVVGRRPRTGWVLIAQPVSAARLSNQLGLTLQLQPVTGGEASTVTRGHALLHVAVPVAGPDGHPVASVEFTMPRDASLLGRRVLMLAVAGSTVLLLLLLVALRRMIARLVLRPLHRVERHMQMVRQSGSLGELDEDGHADEIGSLGRSFNSMLRQLKALREQLEVQSFALGKSESAVAVVHNVRNALTPISTILSQGVAQPPPIDQSTLARAVAELAKDDTPPVRRMKLSAFVAAAIEAEERARAVQVRELEIGREAMAHVLDIIGQQQRQAHERPALDPCDVAELITRNATIARYGGDGSIAFTYPAAPCRVLANRVLLSQVIGNLFSNAAEAIAASGAGEGTIAVSLRVGATVEVLIRDTGEGFDAATGQALFQRGFSTRPHKSGGLGLHWCANSMAAMDGALRLESEGRGKGATAILTLKPAVELAALDRAA